MFEYGIANAFPCALFTFVLVTLFFIVFLGQEVDDDLDNRCTDDLITDSNHGRDCAVHPELVPENGR